MSRYAFFSFRIFSLRQENRLNWPVRKKIVRGRLSENSDSYRMKKG